MYLTIDEIIKNNPINNSILNDNMLNEMKSFGVPTTPKKFKDTLNDLKDCENWNMNNIKSMIKSGKQLLKEEYINQRNAIENKILDTFNNFDNLFINIWEEIKNTCTDIYKQLIEKFNSVINYFKGEFQNIINIWKKIKNVTTNKERKAELKKDLIKTLKSYGGDIMEMFGIYILVDTIKTIWNILKNIWGFSRNKWREFISTLKESGEMLDSNELKETRITGFITLIKNIIPDIGTLGIIILSIVDCNKAEQKLNENALIDAEKNANKSSNTSNNKYSSLLNNIKIDNNDNKENNIDNDQIISICPVYDELSPEIFTEEGIVIEIGTNINDFSLDVIEGEEITNDQTIGTIKNIPIKSIVDGKIIKKDTRYIILQNNKNIDDLANDISSYNIEINDENNLHMPEVDTLTNALTSMNNIEDIFQKYIYYMYKSIIYSNLYNKPLYNSIIKDIDKDIKGAKNKHSKITKSLETNIQHICDSKRVETLAENNQLETIKSEVFNEKIKMIDNIFKNINNYYNSNPEKPIDFVYNIESFNICDEYLSFLTQKIDTNNKYLVSLYETVKSIYVKRFNYEAHNINSLINKFDKILKDNNINNINYFTLNTKNNNTYDKIYTYLSNLKTNIDDDQKQILSNLFIIINEIKANKNKNNNDNIKELTYKESVIIYNYINDIYNEYKNSYNIVNNADKLFNFVNWPNASEIYINNKKYTHYLFVENNIQDITDDEKNDRFSGKTEHEISSINYWLKYCAMATLGNCTLPMYWSTGLVIAGAPIQLPIILVPIKYVQCGDIGALLGLGICGIAIYPMVLMINITFDTQSIMIPINIILAATRKLLQKIKDIQIDGIKMSVQPMIDTISEKIKRTKADIKLLDDEILTLKSMEV